MEKVKKSFFIIPIVLLVIVIGGVWWNMPANFLKNISAEDVAYIKVFDGNTGKRFIIKGTDNIAYIVSNMKGRAMKKEKVSLGYSGTMFQLTFFNENDKVMSEFIVNYYDTIRKDPFFYKDATEGLCVDYLKNLENEMMQ